MIEQSIQLGEPVEHRGVVIAPLFPRRQPVASYVTLEEAIPLGFHVGEVDEAGSVPELLARNPLDANVLLYDGEELLGAKQNRILNVTVLAAAGAATRIPVSCVEVGRWSSRSAAFASSPSHAYPELRRVKAQRLSAEPMPAASPRAQSGTRCAARQPASASSSPTGAQRDIFAARENDLAGLRKAFPLAAGQAGALFALGDRVCLDYVSRPETFVRLYPKLLDGYMLDAVEHLDGTSASEERLAGIPRGRGVSSVEEPALGRSRRGPPARRLRARRLRAHARKRARPALRLQRRRGTAAHERGSPQPPPDRVRRSRRRGSSTRSASCGVNSVSRRSISDEGSSCDGNGHGSLCIAGQGGVPRRPRGCRAVVASLEGAARNR